MLVSSTAVVGVSSDERDVVVLNVSNTSITESILLVMLEMLASVVLVTTALVGYVNSCDRSLGSGVAPIEIMRQLQRLRHVFLNTP